MPALPSVPNVVKTILKYKDSEDNDILNRLFFSFTGTTPTEAIMNALASAIKTAWVNRMQSSTASDLSLSEVETQDLSSPTGATGVDVTVHTGTNTGTKLPGGTCMVISMITPRRYRGGHSRIYLPGLLAEGLLDNQTWTPGLISAIDTAFTNFMGDIGIFSDSGFLINEQVVVSYFLGHTNVLYPSGYYRAVPTARSAPLVTPVTNRRFNSKVGSQRRRNLYVPG